MPTAPSGLAVGCFMQRRESGIREGPVIPREPSARALCADGSDFLRTVYRYAHTALITVVPLSPRWPMESAPDVVRQLRK